MTEEMLETFEALTAKLAGTPEETARLTRDLSAQSVTIKPSPEEFSVLESVCHLRDIEIEGYSTRIRGILSEDNPLLADIDGMRLAMEREYNQENLNEALQAFTNARQENVALLRSLNDDQLDRTGVLEGVGEVTLAKLILMMREHDEAHLDELLMISRVVRSSVDG